MGVSHPTGMHSCKKSCLRGKVSKSYNNIVFFPLLSFLACQEFACLYRNVLYELKAGSATHINYGILLFQRDFKCMKFTLVVSYIEFAKFGVRVLISIVLVMEFAQLYGVVCCNDFASLVI